MSEKARLLAVASPDEWDCWLSKIADDLSPNGNGYPRYSCLICQSFPTCNECMGFGSCLAIPHDEKIDRALARLERAGIWED